MATEEDRINALVDEGVKRYMRQQQQDLLQASAQNSQAIVENGIRECSSRVRDAIDEEIENVQEYDDFKWKNKINKNNFDFTKQVNDIWKKQEQDFVEQGIPVGRGSIITTIADIKKLLRLKYLKTMFFITDSVNFC